jgi:hypothetical protein
MPHHGTLAEECESPAIVNIKLCLLDAKEAERSEDPRMTEGSDHALKTHWHVRLFYLEPSAMPLAALFADPIGVKLHAVSRFLKDVGQNRSRSTLPDQFFRRLSCSQSFAGSICRSLITIAPRSDLTSLKPHNICRFFCSEYQLHSRKIRLRSRLCLGQVRSIESYELRLQISLLHDAIFGRIITTPSGIFKNDFQLR